MTNNIIHLSDYRPPAPARRGRLGRIARRADDALVVMVIAAGLCLLGWLPGHAIKWFAGADAPWYLDIFMTGAPAVVVGIWATLTHERRWRSARCRTPAR